MANAVLHIGVPKTATTTLQVHFFPNLKGFLYLGKILDRDKPHRFLTDEMKGIFRELETRDMGMRLDLPALKDQINGLCEANQTDQVMLSNESISIFSGPNPITKLNRYRSIFDNIKIIYCLRDQMELLTSMFLVLHRPEHFNIRKLKRQSWTPTFDHWIDINFRYCSESFLECFKYHAMISRYRESVGKDNLFVYTFEEFRRDPEALLEQVCKFIGVEVDHELIAHSVGHNENKHATKRSYYYSQLRTRLFPDTRLANFLPRSAVRNFSKFLQASENLRVEPDPVTIERLRNYYAEDNQQLEATMGIRLESQYP